MPTCSVQGCSCSCTSTSCQNTKRIDGQHTLAYYRSAPPQGTEIQPSGTSFVPLALSMLLFAVRSAVLFMLLAAASAALVLVLRRAHSIDSRLDIQQTQMPGAIGPMPRAAASVSAAVVTAAATAATPATLPLPAAPPAAAAVPSLSPFSAPAPAPRAMRTASPTPVSAPASTPAPAFTPAPAVAVIIIPYSMLVLPASPKRAAAARAAMPVPCMHIPSCLLLCYIPYCLQSTPTVLLRLPAAVCPARLRLPLSLLLLLLLLIPCCCHVASRGFKILGCIGVARVLL